MWRCWGLKMITGKTLFRWLISILTFYFKSISSVIERHFYSESTKCVHSLVITIFWFKPTIALCNKSNGSYFIKDFGTLPTIFSISKSKFQPCPSFFPYANIPDKWKRGELSLEQMKKKEKVKVKSQIRYLDACSIQKMRWDVWGISFQTLEAFYNN